MRNGGGCHDRTRGFTEHPSSQACHQEKDHEGDGRDSETMVCPLPSLWGSIS